MKETEDKLEGKVIQILTGGVFFSKVHREEEKKSVYDTEVDP